MARTVGLGWCGPKIELRSNIHGRGLGMAQIHRVSYIYLHPTLLDDILLRNNKEEGIGTVGTFSHSG